MKRQGWTFCMALMLSTAIFADTLDTVLTIETPEETVRMTRDALLAHPGLMQVSITNDRAYPNRTMHHQGVLLCTLLKPLKVRRQDTVELIATDGFHVYVPAEKLMDCTKDVSQAVLAIEPASKWPIIQNHTGTTAGPYEVIWLNPERSHISDEYWAWSMNRIKVTRGLAENQVIAPPETSDAAVRRGYTLFVSHCEGCHSMNQIGESHIGPGFNCPLNPLDYYPDRVILKKFIRNPTSVRVLPKGRMSGTSETSMRDDELNELIDYFAFMKTRKVCKNHD